jgi:Flp pilus assembly protein TadG
MSATARSRLAQRGAILILFTLLLPVLIMLIGLAIDATMLYIVQAKLSAAVDGAALGAGRLLGTSANTTEIAGEFLNANFPAGFWGSTNLLPDIRYTRTLSTRTITISATADVPLLFMRILGRGSTTVAATGVATRKDTRIVLVLDRSTSLDTSDPVTHQNVFTSLKAGAIQFTNMFNPQTDELGLVVFGGSALVAYPPTRPYDPSPTSAGGPDVNFATTQTGGSMLKQLNDMRVGGYTNMAEGMSLAYIEMQKARRRDLAAGADDRLNAIVLFTDGVPSALTAYLNDPLANSLRTGTTCYQSVAASGVPLIGWMRAAPSTNVTGHLTFGTPAGIYRLSSLWPNTTVNYWMTNPTADWTAVTAPSACSELSHQRLGDLYRIPPRDYYGNDTGTNGYLNSTRISGTYVSTQPTVGNNIGIACWNATDNAGNTARQDPMSIAIYTIGYNGSGGIDTALLTRLANTPASTSRNESQQTGLYVQANNTSQLAEAFRTVASDLLRLAQ